MKKLIPFFLILFLFVTSCSDKEPTAPEDVTPAATLAEKTIGPEGGTLEIEDFSLTVPEGAFISSTELKLFAPPNENPFGNSGVTRFFRILGFPSEYSKPLEVRIKFQGSLTEETSIAIGEEILIPRFGETEIVYSRYSAADSSGFLYCQLPASGGSSTTLNEIQAKVFSNGTSSKNLQGVTGEKRILSSAGHFAIHYPEDLMASLQSLNLGDHLEKAYDVFKSMNFEYNKAKWPMEVEFCFFTNTSLNRYCFMHKGTFVFNLANMYPTSLSKIRAAVGNTFFDAIASWYDTRYYAASTGLANPYNFWLHCAVASWSEEKFIDGDPTTYIPANFAPNQMSPLLGMERDLGESLVQSMNHGRGMAALIKYLVKNYGQETILKIYKELEIGTESPFKSIIKNINKSINEWLPDFYQDYISGNIYKLDNNKFASEATGVFNISSKDNTIINFGEDLYNNASAKLYLINLTFDINSTEIGIGSRVELYTDRKPSDAAVIIFGLKSEGLELFGKAHCPDSFKVKKDLMTLKKEGFNSLLIVVVNSNLEGSTISADKIKLEGKVILLDFNWCRIYVKCGADYITEKGINIYDASFEYVWKAFGERKGNDWKFSHWDTKDSRQNEESEGSLIIKFDANLPQVITNYKADEIKPDRFHDNGQKTIEGTDYGMEMILIQDQYFPDQYYYQASVSGGRTSFYFKKEIISNGYDYWGVWVELTETRTDENSKLEIILGYKEDN